ncbi:two-component system histidine kinase PnpS [Aerococcus sanguinicola]|uniref:two-component system histidine kinase PnpS n=1 Tax=unclassified Aerococcus TaxID=2618060 RepID=UPI0008A52C4D|nr:MULTISPECIES: ATP-binding protein [unclassified Aerococcus]MDK6233286.1 ATP-binding protein [Aerococcus sp. UMB10185]MDK6804914.1 ATP-binding protein [Aerococcus sp. UMB7834]MDK6855114.1 ATP-binding protein [Aerococcus sp. UMB7533]MDK8501970.1 ATP-binding protein [Aerococcus sp. UMB1112A]OFN04452.1 hypothetical protein HMPREF2626_00230 [Aerococcus sp. HMSC062A02]
MKRLTARLTGLFALLFILYSFLFAYNANLVVEHAVGEETQEQMTETAATLRKSFMSLDEENIQNRDRKWVGMINNLIGVLNPAERIIIYDMDKRELIAMGNADLPAAPRESQAFDRAWANTTDFKTHDNNSEDNTIYQYTEFMRNSKGDPIAYIQIIRAVSDLSAAQSRLMGIAFICSILAMAVLLALLYYYFKRLSNPVQAITRIVDDLSHNDYQSRYESKGIEEFDEIGRNINGLAENLERQQGQILTQQKRLNQLIDYLIVGVLLIDDQQRIQVSNSAFFTILGIETNDIWGKRYDNVLHGYRLKQMIENCFQDKSNYNDEVYLYYPKEVILDVNVIYIEESPAGPDTGSQVIVLIYDITEIRRLEKVRTDFISNASHELKTPITSIQGFAETLLDGALEDPDLAQEFVGIIASESNRLTSLISDILDLSKIEQDQIGHKVESIDLEVLANGAVVQAEELALRKGISLHTVNLREEPIIFNSEAGRIDQILTNLVNNGIKYTNPGGDVWIILDLMEAEGYVHISVKDNGVGIPREDLPRIFERFYRVSKDRSTNSGGTGLGLSIVRNLVNSMNGKIHVESQYGQGSCFNVYLPMLDLEDNDDGIEILEE